MSTAGETQTIILPATGPNPTATLLVPAENGVNLVYNNGPGILYIGNLNSILPTDSTVIPLAVGSSVVVTGDHNTYGVVPVGSPTTVYILDGGLNFFAPTSLTGLGGVKIFNQPTMPTAPPPIPVNSLWFTSTGQIQVWNGAAWVPQQFSGQQIIEANTIFAAQLAAGIIYAGIVDGTLIEGAQMRILNAHGATIMTINVSAGSWIQYVDTGSAAQGYLVSSSIRSGAFTDEFGNAGLGGIVTYANIGGTYYSVQCLNGNINFSSAPANTGPWNIYTSLEPDAALGYMVYFDNNGDELFLGTYSVRVPSTITINSTTPITILTLNVAKAISYKITMKIVYLGGGTAANAGISWGGTATISNSLGVLRRARGSTNTDNVLPVNQNSALGALAFPFNAGELCTYEWEGIITFSAAGTFTVRGNEGTAGATFAIATNSYMQLELA